MLWALQRHLCRRSHYAVPGAAVFTATATATATSTFSLSSGPAAASAAAMTPAVSYGPTTLKGSSVLIFGGSSGIGKAIAAGAAEQGAAVVHIIGRDPQKLERAKAEISEVAGPATSIRASSVDVTKENEVRQFFDSFAEESVDHLVTTPGGSAKCGDLIKNGRTCDDVRRQMDLKFYAQLAPVLAIGSKIKAGGSIVMTSGTPLSIPLCLHRKVVVFV